MLPLNPNDTNLFYADDLHLKYLYQFLEFKFYSFLYTHLASVSLFLLFLLMNPNIYKAFFMMVDNSMYFLLHFSIIIHQRNFLYPLSSSFLFLLSILLSYHLFLSRKDLFLVNEKNTKSHKLLLSYHEGFEVEIWNIFFSRSFSSHHLLALIDFL